VKLISLSKFENILVFSFLWSARWTFSWWFEWFGGHLDFSESLLDGFVVNEALEPLSQVLVGLSESIIENSLESKNEAGCQEEVSNGHVITRNPLFALKVGIQYLSRCFAFFYTIGVFLLIWWAVSQNWHQWIMHLW